MHDTIQASGDATPMSREPFPAPFNLVVLRRAATAALSLAAAGMAAGPIPFPAPGPVGR
jgi:hypothetical protein